MLQPNSTGTGLLPDLASSWSIAKNGLTDTFHLRPSAEFSNGMPVTAADVVYSIQRSRAYKGGWGFLLTAVKAITGEEEPRLLAVDTALPTAQALHDLAASFTARAARPGGAGFLRDGPVLLRPGPEPGTARALADV